MVVKNPLFSGRWTAKKFGATVLDDTWPEVAFFTLVATVIVLVSELTDVKLGVSNQLLTVLGLVLGLVISFRTSSAYERYQDGRKMWSNISVASRHIAQMIWIHVPNDRPAPADSKAKPITNLEAALEKKAMVNMVQAFSVSVKHLLRGEQGPYYEDLYPLIAFLPKYATKADERVGRESDKLPLWHFRDQRQHLVDTVSQAAALIVIPEAEPMTEGAHTHRRSTSDATIIAADPSEKEPLSPQQMDDTAKASALPDRTPDIGESARKRRFSYFRVVPPNATFDPYVVLPRIESPFPLQPARNPPRRTFYDFFPMLKIFRWLGKRITFRKTFKSKEEQEEERKHSRRKAYGSIVESHIPLEICLVLSNYSNYLMKNNLLQGAIATSMTNSLVLLQDTLSNLERICNTPLPFAYQAHLRMSLWLYLTLLPFQIYSAYRYITIPATAFASFLLLGFLEIGQEIENPFNYDLNDLDLDLFCLTIQRDLHLITAHTNPNLHDYLFTKLNQPLAPFDRRHAAEILKDKSQEYTHPDDDESEPGFASLRKALLEGWKEVDTRTRKD